MIEVNLLRDRRASAFATALLGEAESVLTLADLRKIRDHMLNTGVRFTAAEEMFLVVHPKQFHELKEMGMHSHVAPHRISDVRPLTEDERLAEDFADALDPLIDPLFHGNTGVYNGLNIHESVKAIAPHSHTLLKP